VAVAVATAGTTGIEIDERELLRRCRRGERSAYEGIVTRYRGRAYRVALGLVGTPQDARDLTQEAFVRAFLKIDRFDVERPFFPWFYRILKNLCLTFLARRKRRGEVSIEPAEPDGAPMVLEAGGVSPEQAAIREEQARLLWAAIHRLKEREREIIILRHFLDQSYAEIAESLGIPRGTVMSRLFYARRALRDQVGVHLGGER